jgi:hypothetical protein
VKRLLDVSRDVLAYARSLMLGLVWCCAMTSVTVHAGEPKVVLGATTVSGFIEADGELARNALAEALRMQGMRVTPLSPSTGDAVASRGCDLACGARLLATSAADMSAWVKLSKTDAAAGGIATVTFLDAAGHRYEGAADVRDGDIREATTRAVLEARSDPLLGPGPWLRIAGTPEGAEVLIDGTIVGTVPYRAPIASGAHKLSVREPGYMRLQYTLEVPDDDARKFELKVALEPTPLTSQTPLDAEQAVAESGAPLRAPEAATEAAPTQSRVWLAGPIALGLVGVGLAAVITARIATGPADCVDPDLEQRCVERRYVAGAPTIAGYAVSALMIGGAATWLVLGMEDGAEATESTGVRLHARVGLGHVALSGSF